VSAFSRLVGSLTLVVGGLLAAGLVGLLVAHPKLRRPAVWIDRVRERACPLVFLAVAVAFKRLVEGIVPAVASLVGLNVTHLLYAIEGDLVAVLQSVASPPVTAYFAFVYVHGFSLLLLFPVLAYIAHPDPHPLRKTAVAYSVNYLVGLAGYAAFVAYGPRNHIPFEVVSLLYTHWPESYLLTSSMNASTNVFPSLHASFSVTIVVLAWRTRAEYPVWAGVATVLGTSIVFATMYLGIHWATDVVAGVALAAGAVAVADRDPLSHLDVALARIAEHSDWSSPR